MDPGEFVFNGIDGLTGDYLVPPMKPSQVRELASGSRTKDQRHLLELKAWYQRASEATFGPKEGVDPTDLAQSGWGVIFAAGDDPAVREALTPLLAHRRRQATAHHERYYREFVGRDGYRAGESKQDFLARHGAGPGPADPNKVPYFLLVVADPAAIPFSFQYQLDVQYAVGRLHFDAVDDYAAYASTVVAIETGTAKLPPKAVFFGAVNPGDRATALSAAQLVTPLADALRAEHPHWDVEELVGEPATKAALGTLLDGGEPPALLFSATHGVGFPYGHARQWRHQGALVCQDWPGPGRGKRMLDEHLFSGDDIDDDAHVAGLISFHFACYGGGTPVWDDFVDPSIGERDRVAERPFVAGLPKRLLGHPRGGALATIAHVERAWGYSFVWPGAGQQTTVFESCLGRLLAGHPIGSAFEYFNERYAELSSDLTVELEEVSFGKIPDDQQLGAMWTANNDARNFAIIGDPAVRLAIADGAAAQDEFRARITVPLTAQRRPATRPATPSPAGPSSLAAADRGPGSQEGPVSGPTPVQAVAADLGRLVEQAIQNLASLEVRTYVGDDVADAADAADPQSTGAELRFVTRVSVDGGLTLVVPRSAGDVDDKLWRMHLSMVKAARASASELLAAAASALRTVVDPPTPR